MENVDRIGDTHKEFEYSVDLSGKDIFPNNTMKEDVLTHYRPSTFKINTLKYTLLGFDITASDIKIKVEPSRIDTTTTKVDLPLVVARDVSVTKGLIHLRYDQINLSSIYGIYHKISDKMTIQYQLMSHCATFLAVSPNFSIYHCLKQTALYANSIVC
jgi:hypothetical protein